MKGTQRLKELRTERKISQEKLAELLSVSRQTVSNWETGKTAPNAEALTGMAEIYGVSVAVLLGEEPPQPAPEPAAAVPETAPARKVRPWIVAAAAILLAILIAAGGMVWWSTADRSVPMDETDVREEVTEPPVTTLPLLPLE